MNRLPPLIGTLLLLLGAPALAHESIVSGPVTVLFHVAPDDVPQPQKEMTIYIGIADTEKGFRLADCTCTLTVSEKGRVLRIAQLTPSPDPKYYGIAGIPFTFNDLAIYDLVVRGEPKISGLFTPFTVHDAVGVEPPDGQVTPMTPMEHMHMGPLDSINMALFGIALAFLLGALIFERARSTPHKRR